MKIARADRVRIIIQWVVVGFVITGGYTFSRKVYEFIATASRGEMPGFAALTIVPYLVVMLGFLCLVVGAYLRGHFSDLEKPKYTMIETERELDELARQQQGAKR